MKIEKVKKILDIIKERKMVSVTNLQKELNIPRTSLLRYLSELEENGEITKTFGEVKIRESHRESWATGRTKTHKTEKGNIAKIVSELIKEGEVIFIDGGTTTFKIAKELHDKKIIIYTNNLLVSSLINPDYKPEVVFVPGKINKNTLCAASIETIKYIETINFSKSFLGFNSMVDGNFSTTNSEEAFVKQSVANSTKKQGIYLVGGSYKIDSKAAQYSFGTRDNVTLITEKGVE
ncbi:DeoR/GlpR family DNA-binding transcription regulator [Mycoplasma marinum]|uniref:HTH deoR-type domain-containing protein n=1 Tax=Mycoplasma marinum TaxID=1937190 RepID=A0A4R0XKJ8_9MOLU|nr:DeoR/GlpR family DNA-binding transcription regulator [Mycoplasma marinum]TCG10984.1 hypothetical protein C4B24_03415 [Mycoplasma marinum]